MGCTSGAHFWWINLALLSLTQGIPATPSLAQSGRSFQWPAIAPREEVPAAFTSAPLVVLSEEIHFGNRVEHTGQPGSMKATADVHGILRVMDAEGVRIASTTGIRIDGALTSENRHARVIHPDGTVRELAGDAVHAFGSDFSENDPRRLVFNRSDLAVGDDIEYVVRSAIEGPLRFEALYLQGEHPILRKEIVLDMEASITPLIQVYNGFPRYEADPVGAEDRRRTHVRNAPETDRYRWRAGPLQPVSADPMLLKRDCLPFLRIRGATPDVGTQAARAQLAFNHDFPHLTVHGRAHENDFTRFVELVRGKYPYGSITGPIAEVMRFLRDSVRVVQFPRSEPARSVGEYFHDRRIPYDKLISLYRSLFIILEIPFDVGYARSSYLETIAPDSADIVRATHLLLAFQDGTANGLHVICPASTHGAWLLDEVPMEIAGTTATFFKFRLGLMPPEEIFTHALPMPRIADNGRIERLALRVDTGGSVLRTHVSGSLKGYPAAIAENAAMTGPGEAALDALDARIAPWFALPRGAGPVPGSASNAGSRMFTYSAIAGREGDLPLGNAASFSLGDVFPLPLRNWPSPPDSCASYIPFPFAVRSDIVVTVGPADGPGFRPMQPVNMENEAGAFRCTMETLEDGRYLVHLEYMSTATLVDNTMAQHIAALQETARDVLDRPLFVR